MPTTTTVALALRDIERVNGATYNLPPVRATDEQRAELKRVVTPAYPSGESCVTGIVEDEDDRVYVVRMYSAHCLHDLYVIEKHDVIRVEDY